MSVITLKTRYYQQFDADFSREVPAEGYGGWKSAELPLETEHTALVVMHAWDHGEREQYPGWHRAVEYLPRAREICLDIFPKLLDTVRRSPLRIFHVVSGGQYYQNLPGYQLASRLTRESQTVQHTVESTESYQKLGQFRKEHSFVGLHNQEDVRKGFQNIDFAPQARPVNDEGIAENQHQLFALCQHFGINHLIYVGFAINWCLLLSPGGMAEMNRYGLLCSTISEAVTAVENKETAAREMAKQIALWRVALAYGFVYSLDDFIAVLNKSLANKIVPQEEERTV